MKEFFAMGGYGAYVWSAYGITFVVMLWNVVAPVLCARRRMRDLSGRLRRRAGGAAS